MRHLAKLRRPRLTNIHRIACIFPTSYGILDADFPDRVRECRPDVILMFGLALRTRHLRVETMARNVLTASLPDAQRARPARARLTAGATAALCTRAPCIRLLQAIRTARVPAALSRNAGRYLCNALYWRALEAAAQPDGPRLVVFIHVPPVERGSTPSTRMRGRWRANMTDLRRAGEAILRAAVAVTQRD